MKIFCIGRNYVDHAKELNNQVPKQPLVFMKPPTALLRNNDPFYIPEFSEDVHYELELVLKIKKNGKYIQPAFTKDYYESIALGIDFTARDLQSKLKEKGHPWEIAKGFDNSAALSSFVNLPTEENIKFQLFKNDVLVQDGSSQDMIFNFDTLIVHISKFFTLQQGDLIYTGTPAGVGPVSIGDHLVGTLQGQTLFDFYIK